MARVQLRVGDVVEGWDVARRITEVRETGYTWVYEPDVWDGRDFMSENSNDPFFEVGWTVREPRPPENSS